MRIPRLTKIILVPDNEHGAREYSLSRRLAIALMVLAFLALAAVVILLVSFSNQVDTQLRLHELEARLATAEIDTRTVLELRRELDESRRLQEKLLYMLGVDELPPAATDTLNIDDREKASAPGQALSQAASLALPPEPGLWPAAGKVTKEFDKGKPVEGRRPHLGIDIAGPRDTPILAVAPGEVVRVGTDDYLGNYVEIRHGLGYLTVYGHLARAAVNAGERVQGGQVIAYMGDSGQTTGTHLHFEMWRQGEAVDPRRYLTGEPPPQ